MKLGKKAALCLMAIMVFQIGLFAPAYAVTNTQRVSITSDGDQANPSDITGTAGTISADGRYTVFTSNSSNLVADDTNGMLDIFVHDNQSGGTSRVSLASDGTQADGSSFYPVISADGNYVAFTSGASNFVAEEEWNGQDHIYVRNLQTGETSIVTVSADSVLGDGSSYWPSISADGRYVSFNSYATNLIPEGTDRTQHIFVRDRQNSSTSIVSLSTESEYGNDSSNTSSISSDGRYIAFSSNASNLVSDDINGLSDVFIRDTQVGSTVIASVASSGEHGDAESYNAIISANGTSVTFMSFATNLISNDTNESWDAFVYDIQTAETSRVSVASDGAQSDMESHVPSISADGRYVVFASCATNLVANDNNGQMDAFVHDRQTGQTALLSVSSAEVQGDGMSYWPTINANGNYVLFISNATNLVTGDTNEGFDYFVTNNPLSA